MGIVIDIVLAAVIIGIIVWSAHKGVLVTIAEVLAFALAIFLAAHTAKPIAQVMYKAFFYKGVQKAIYNELPSNSAAMTTAQKAQLVFDGMPEFARKQAEKVGINVSAISNQLSKTKLGSGDIYKELEEKIVRPIAVEVLKHILYFFLAIIYGIILRFIFAAVAKGLKDTDTIGTADKVAGAAVGIVEGLVIVFLISNLLVYIQPRFEKESARKAISDSAIVQMCDKFNPMEAVSMAQAFLEEK